jgi:hypothetical protein
MGQCGLGKSYDLAQCFTPVDLSAGAPAAGDVINLRNAAGVDVILVSSAGAANDIITLTFQQAHGIAGTPKALCVDHYYQKLDTLLTTGTAWEKVANGVAGTGITTIAGSATSDDAQIIWVVPIEASSLDAGYDCVVVTSAQTAGAGSKFTSVMYLLRDLAHQRTPANLPNPLI